MRLRCRRCCSDRISGNRRCVRRQFKTHVDLADDSACRGLLFHGNPCGKDGRNCLLPLAPLASRPRTPLQMVLRPRHTGDNTSNQRAADQLHSRLTWATDQPMKLVIHPPVEDERLGRLVAVAGSMTVVNAANEAEAQRHMPDGDAFFGKITPSLLAGEKQLRWVQSPTASLEHYLFPELAAHPCVVTNMRGLFSDVIADQVMGYVICFARNLHLYILHASTGRWAPVGGEAERVAFASGPATVTAIDRAHRHLADLTLGVVGLGAIGGEVARRASAFGMRVVAVDPRPIEAAPGIAALWPVEELPQLLAQSDFVVIAAPHTPQTAAMFQRPQFRQMKRDAYFINVGRGAIVALDDLVAALEAGEIAGAALDVFETEPLPPDHALWKMAGRVVLTPHVAGYSPRIAGRHLDLLLDNVGRFVRGEPLRNVVDKQKWY